MVSRILNGFKRVAFVFANMVLVVSLLPGTGVSAYVTSGNNARISGDLRGTQSNEIYDPSFSIPGDKMAAFNQLSLHPNIETVGVVVKGTSLPATAELFYRLNSDIHWRPAHRLMRIDEGRLVGSLFGLSPSTTYNVRVTDGANEIIGSVTTQVVELQFMPLSIVYVNDDAPAGGNGSLAAPFKTIQEGVNLATPGTQVLVADGTYHESVFFPASGTAGNWIQVKAEGNAAMLDGSDNLTGNIWTAFESTPRVRYTRIGTHIKYLARDHKRLYMYEDRNGLMQSRGLNGITINEGWYFEPTTNRLYVRSLDNPSSHAWQVPSLNHAFDIDGRDWLWIEGFEIRHYGTRTDGCGVCSINSSHLVIRRNKIHNMQLGIFINWTGNDLQGNDTRIEYNELFDNPAAEWPWQAIKTGSMEGTGIILRGHIGAIVRNNEIHHFFNGIYTGAAGTFAENSGIAFDADIYNNRIHHIGDDGLEPEGACINQRFRNNTVDTILVGISLAPITQGPVWVMRSLFTNYTGRRIKWARDPDGIVLIYHNTSWTNAAGRNAMSVITPMKNSVMANNIFQGNGYAFEAIVTGATGNDWNFDNWHTTRSSTSSHFKWENIGYLNMSQLCAATGLECNGHENPPGLVNPSGGDFTLLPTSPNIDRGIFFPGINDIFIGNAPDLGAYEFGTSP